MPGSGKRRFPLLKSSCIGLALVLAATFAYFCPFEAFALLVSGLLISRLFAVVSRAVDSQMNREEFILILFLLLLFVAALQYLPELVHVMRDLLPSAVPAKRNPVSWTTLVHGSSSVISAIPVSAVNGVEQFSTSLFLLAQAGAVAELKSKLREVLDLIMLFGFLYGTVRIISGAMMIQRGETETGKNSIISGALIAAAPLIMRILYEVFFEKGGSVFG